MSALVHHLQILMVDDNIREVLLGSCSSSQLLSWQDRVIKNFIKVLTDIESIPTQLVFTIISLLVSFSPDSCSGAKNCGLLISSATTFSKSSSGTKDVETSFISPSVDGVAEDQETVDNSINDTSASVPEIHQSSSLGFKLINFKNGKVANIVLSESLRILGRSLLREMKEVSTRASKDLLHFQEHVLRKLCTIKMDYDKFMERRISSFTMFGRHQQYIGLVDSLLQSPVLEIGKSIFGTFDAPKLTTKSMAENVSSEENDKEDGDSSYNHCSLSPTVIDGLWQKHRRVLIHLATKFILCASKELKALDRKIKYLLKVFVRMETESKGRKRRGVTTGSTCEIWSEDEEEMCDEQLESSKDCIVEQGVRGEKNWRLEMAPVEDGDESINDKEEENKDGIEIVLPMSHVHDKGKSLVDADGSNSLISIGIQTYDFLVYFLENGDTCSFASAAGWASNSGHIPGVQSLQFRIGKFELDLSNLLASIKHLQRRNHSHILEVIKEKGTNLLRSLRPHESIHVVGKKRSEDCNEDGDSDEDGPGFQSYAPTRQRRKRLRSRNSVIDEWLDYEAGDDAYADLEDFLVE